MATKMTTKAYNKRDMSLGLQKKQNSGRNEGKKHSEIGLKPTSYLRALKNQKESSKKDNFSSTSKEPPNEKENNQKENPFLKFNPETNDYDLLPMNMSSIISGKKKGESKRQTDNNFKDNPFFKFNPDTNDYDLLPLNLKSVTSDNNKKGESKKRTENFKDNPFFKFNPDTNDYDLLPLNLQLVTSDKKKGKPNSAQKQNSAKKRKEDNLEDNEFFKFNSETNEFDLQPVNFSLLTSSSRKVPKSSGKKKTPIILVTPSTAEAPHSNPKIRKLEHGVRKELFKVPVNKPQSKRRLSVKTIRSSGQQASPLGYPFKSPRRPVFKFTTIQEERESISSGDSEFLELEKLCGADVESDQSPVSSVCEMMESTMQLDSAKKEQHKSFESKETEQLSTSKALMEIEEILENDELRYQHLQDQISIYDKEHQHNLNRIHAVIRRLRNKDDCRNEGNKENDSNNQRRSLRLRNKNGDSCSNALASPVLLKAGDLRKKTLTKSLVDKYQKYQIQSPRIEKALSLYNTVRKDVSILSTPKMNRNIMVATPGGAPSAKNLSLRVQKQCLLLQDTPIAK